MRRHPEALVGIAGGAGALALWCVTRAVMGASLPWGTVVLAIFLNGFAGLGACLVGIGRRRGWEGEFWLLCGLICYLVSGSIGATVARYSVAETNSVQQGE